MPNLRIVFPNAVDQGAAISGSPAPVATMPASNLKLISRGDVVRSTSLAPQVFADHWDGSLKAINAWGLFRANLVGAQVRLQLYSDVAMTTEIENTGLVDIYTGGPTWGNFNWGEVPWFTAANDPLAAEAPFFKFLATKRYAAAYKLTITNPGGMSQSYFELSRLWLGEYLEAPWNPAYGKQLGWENGTESIRTRGGSQRPNRGERWRVMHVDMLLDTEADRATWLDLQARLDSSQPCVVSLYPGQGGRNERDNTFEATIRGQDPQSHQNALDHQQVITFQET